MDTLINVGFVLYCIYRWEPEGHWSDQIKAQGKDLELEAWMYLGTNMSCHFPSDPTQHDCRWKQTALFYHRTYQPIQNHQPVRPNRHTVILVTPQQTAWSAPTSGASPPGLLLHVLPLPGSPPAAAGPGPGVWSCAAPPDCGPPPPPAGRRPKCCEPATTSQTSRAAVPGWRGAPRFVSPG